MRCLPFPSLTRQMPESGGAESPSGLRALFRLAVWPVVEGQGSWPRAKVKCGIESQGTLTAKISFPKQALRAFASLLFYSVL